MPYKWRFTKKHALLVNRNGILVDRKSRRLSNYVGFYARFSSCGYLFVFRSHILKTKPSIEFHLMTCETKVNREKDQVEIKLMRMIIN